MSAVPQPIPNPEPKMRLVGVEAQPPAVSNGDDLERRRAALREIAIECIVARARQILEERRA